MIELILSSGLKKEISVSYADFLKKIAAVPVLGGATSASSGYFKAVPIVTSGTMWGTPYGAYFTNDSTSQLAIRHAFPNSDIFNDAVINKRYCVIKILYVTTYPTFPAVSRNGYTSRSYGSFSATKAISFIYYDSTEEAMMEYSPFSKTQPVPWDGNLS